MIKNFLFVVLLYDFCLFKFFLLDYLLLVRIDYLNTEVVYYLCSLLVRISHYFIFSISSYVVLG